MRFNRYQILFGCLLTATVFILSNFNGFMAIDSRRFIWQSKKEVRHIAFLKVHKTGSTSLQNIFLRFGRVRNLTFVIPGDPRAVYPNIISLDKSVTKKNVIPPPRGRSFDILCCHVIYSSAAFRSIMPRDTAYIGILREPWKQFISTLHYFRPSEVMDIRSENPVSTFLLNPDKYLTGHPKWSLVNNRMAFEYNFPSHLFKEKNNKREIMEYLHKLDKEFNLVVIAEYFDESLVLMRRYLNWKIKDILYVRFNVRSKDLDSRLQFTNETDRQQYRKFATLDFALYDYFLNRLRYEINQERNYFQKEVSYFKNVRQQVGYFCNAKRHASETLPVAKSNWSESFVITHYDCKLLNMPEIKFIKLIRSKQYPSLDLEHLKMRMKNQ